MFIGNGSFFYYLGGFQMTLANKLAVLSNENLHWIYGATLKILEQTGVIFHSEDALAICKKRGAKVSGKTIFFPKKISRQALENVPETFSWRLKILSKTSMSWQNGTLFRALFSAASPALKMWT